MVQLDDDGSSEDARETGLYNRTHFAEMVTAFRLENVLCGGWVTQGGNLYLVPSDCDLAIAEMEGPGDYDGILNVINGVGAGPLPRCPLGVITNFSTMTRERVKPLIAANFTCLPEAYLNENSGWTPDVMDRVARSLGWSTSQPTAGVYPVGGQPVPSYAQWASWPLADYLLEYVI